MIIYITKNKIYTNINNLEGRKLNHARLISISYRYRGRVARSQIQINTNKEAIRGVINDLILCEKNNKTKSVDIK